MNYILLMALISFGLFYDAFTISLSGLLSLSIIKTNLFKFLSSLRYISHGISVPSLFLICEENLPKNKKRHLFILIITLIFIICGILQGIFTDLEIVKTGLINRYASSKNTPKWALFLGAMVTIIPMIYLHIVGFIIFNKKKNPYMLIGGVFMLIFASLGGSVKSIREYNYFISMIGEVPMNICFYLHIIKENNKNPQAQKVKKVK
ncbi:hypothetical protein H8356DRAFT_1625782 [Neocallimastix lanati (nom. inval.)]|nr:hypothetical protein H8356DRAFT_1625782 [Neocallimastix sp. JGI-2020a]